MNTLIVVDMQNDFVDIINGKLPVKNAFNALLNICNLIESGKIDEVIFTADWHIHSHESFTRNGGQWPEHCIQFSEGAAICDGLLQCCIKSKVPYYVTTKAHVNEEYGAFQNITYSSNSRQLHFLDGDKFHCVKNYEAGKDKFIVCGVAGDYCVLNTLKNLELVWDDVQVYLPGIASIDDGTTLLKFIKENKLNTLLDSENDN